MEAMSARTHTCDCGQPADKLTGSGWTCEPCERKTREADAALEAHLRTIRAEESGLSESYLEHRPTLLDYWRERYHRRKRAA